MGIVPRRPAAMSAAAGMPWAPLWDVWIVAAAATAVYINSLGHGFCYDDIRAIEMNMDLRPEHTSLGSIFLNDFWGATLAADHSHKSYRPLTVLTYRLTYLLGGLDPWYYHAGNIAAYALACAAWWWVAAHAVPLGRAGRFLAGLAFAVHPMHAENVASVVGRADTLSAVAYAVCIAAYVRGGVRGSWVWMCGAWCAGAAGMLCKEHGLLGVCAGAACDLCGRGRLLRVSEWRWETTGRAAVRAGASACFVAGALAWGVWMRGDSLTPKTNRWENPMAYEETLAGRWAWWSEVHFWYAVQLVYPRWSCIDWGYNVIPRPSVPWRGLATYLLVLGIPLLLLRTRHRERAVVCCALTVVPFLPSSGLLRVGTTLAERLLLLPSMGFTLALGVVFEWAAGADAAPSTDEDPPPSTYESLVLPSLPSTRVTRGGGLHRRKSPAAQRRDASKTSTTAADTNAEPVGTMGGGGRHIVLWAAFYIMCVVWAVWSVRNSARWSNGMTLYEASAATCTENARVHMFLEMELDENNSTLIPRRRRLLERSLAIAPELAATAMRLGMLHRAGKNTDEAEKWLAQAVKHGPGLTQAIYNLAHLTFHERGDHARGLALFRRLMEVCHRKKVCETVGSLYLYHGRYADALMVALDAVPTAETEKRRTLRRGALDSYHKAIVEGKRSVHAFEPVGEDRCTWFTNYFAVAIGEHDFIHAEHALPYMIDECSHILDQYLVRARSRKMLTTGLGHVAEFRAHLQKVPLPNA